MTSIAELYPGQPITQTYGNPNAGEPAGWHHGVDIGLPADYLVLAPVAGTYDAAASGAYTIAEDVPGQGELLFLHVRNILSGMPSGTPIPQGVALGNVLGVNPDTGQAFADADASGNLPGQDYYKDPVSGISYSETGPHLHLEAHSVAGAMPGSGSGVEDPNTFLAGLSSPGSTPGAPPPFTTAPPPLVDPGHWFGPGGATDPSHYVSGNVPGWFGGVAAIVTKVAISGALLVAGMGAIYLGVKQFTPGLPSPTAAAATAAVAA